MFPQMTSNDSSLEKLLNKNTTEIENCKQWLRIFGKWKPFIESNFLQGFIHIDDNVYGQPKMFFEGHSFENPTPSEEQFKDYFETMSKLIKVRGRDIARKIKRNGLV